MDDRTATTPNWRLLSAILIALSAATSGCAGAGGEEEEEEEDEGPFISAGGLWEGTITTDGAAARPMVGLVTDEGDVALVVQAANGPFFFGQGDIPSGNQVEATATGFARPQNPWPDGSTRATATFHGTVSTAFSLGGNYSAGGETGTLSLRYNSLYDRDASLATLAGVYTAVVPAGVPAATMAVNSNGDTTINGSTGCVGNGRLRVVYPQFNAYKGTITFGNCGAGDGRWDYIMYLRDVAGGTSNQLVVFGAQQTHANAVGGAIWNK